MKAKQTGKKSVSPDRSGRRVARRADTGEFKSAKDATEPKSARLEGRMALHIKRIIQRAAELSGRSFTDFVVSAAHQDALRTIREHEILKLSDRDTKAFLEALAAPPKPNLRLRKAAQRFQNLKGSE